MKGLIEDMNDSMASARTLNQAFDTLFGPVHATSPKRVIDLRNRTYDIHLECDPVMAERWTAIDRVSFDDDPESRWCIRGTGKTTTEAVTDLLDQIAEAELAKQIEQRTPMQMVYSNPFEPPEFKAIPYTDPDEE
jgi:hypothetical protein